MYYARAANTILEKKRMSVSAINNNDVVANAIAHAAVVTPELKDTVKALIMKEQADTLTSVLIRLNGDEDGKSWETVRREPATLIAMLVQEHAKRLEELLLLLRKEEEKNEEKNNND
jgi:hypothetical protein